MLTERMLAYVQCCMMAATFDGRQTDLYARFERIEAYLIRRILREE